MDDSPANCNPKTHRRVQAVSAAVAAAVLRLLIAEKVIADGEVDERSIEEVQPEDLAGFRAAQVPQGCSAFGQEVGGMLGITPKPFQATGDLPPSAAPRTVRGPACVLFQSPCFHRTLRNFAEHSDLERKTSGSGNRVEALLLSEHDRLPLLLVCANETRARIGHFERGGTWLNKSTYSPAQPSIQCVVHKRGSHGLLPVSLLGGFSDNGPYICQSKICDGNAKRAEVQNHNLRSASWDYGITS